MPLPSLRILSKNVILNSSNQQFIQEGSNHMNSKTSNRINMHKHNLIRRRILHTILACTLFILLCVLMIIFINLVFFKKIDISISAKSTEILQGEELPELLADITYDGDEKLILDKKENYRAKDLIHMLKSGKGYEITCEADTDTEGVYPIKITLSSDIQKKLDSGSWAKRLNLSLHNGKLTVKNPIGEWDGNKFKRYDGTYVTDSFVTSMDDKYYFDSDGNMVTGWKTIQDSIYHFSDKGVMDTSTWQEKDGDRYYLGSDGAAVVGWNEIDDETYYFDSSGKMATGTVYIGLSKCKFDAFGKLLSKKESKANPDKPAIALTFDDGPGSRTMELLDTLEQYSAHATFFMLGQKVGSYPDAVKKMEEIGCELGNHSYDHANLSKVSAAKIQEEIGDTNKKIKDITGSDATVMRPPYGAISQTLKSTVGMPMILWNIDTLDWKTRNTQTTIDTVMDQVKDGDIILMHDIHTETIDAAIALIPKLQEKGYQLVTVSELAALKGETLSAGEKYTDF